MHRAGVLNFLTSPAVLVSALLALLGAYLWEEYPAEAIVAFLWIPIFLTCRLIYFVFHYRQPHSSHLEGEPTI